MGMEMMNSEEAVNLPLVPGLINTSALHPNESKFASPPNPPPKLLVLGLPF